MHFEEVLFGRVSDFAVGRHFLLWFHIILYWRLSFLCHHRLICRLCLQYLRAFVDVHLTRLQNACNILTTATTCKPVCKLKHRNCTRTQILCTVKSPFNVCVGVIKNDVDKIYFTDGGQKT